jgi:ketosteroid isomerase-like protein
MSNRIEVLKQFFAAINRNDLPAVIKDLDPDLWRMEFEGSPTGGTYRGIAEFKQLFEKARATWAEGACNPESFLESGDKVIVDVHVHVRLHGSTQWIDGRVADAFMFRDGRIIEFHSFDERAKALKWAGIQD